MPPQIHVSLEFCILIDQFKKNKNRIKNKKHMNLNLTSSSSRTQKSITQKTSYKPKKSNIRTQENQTQKNQTHNLSSASNSKTPFLLFSAPLSFFFESYFSKHKKQLNFKKQHFSFCFGDFEVSYFY